MIKNRASRSIKTLAFLFILALAACSSSESELRRNPQLVASPDKVSAMLAEAATRASRSLETLAAVEQERGPAVAAPQIGYAPKELRTPVTVRWIGPVGPITESLANKARYNFTTVGKAPATPVVVSVDVEAVSIIEVLRSIGLQLGDRADVRVNSDTKTVELHYAPNNSPDMEY